MSTDLAPPKDALDADSYQRFMYACAHERRSPSTQSLIDAASYGWVYRFIQENGVESETSPEGDWLEPHDATPRKLAEYFKRVGLRLRHTEAAFDYATSLEKHFTEIADSKEYPGASS